MLLPAAALLILIVGVSVIAASTMRDSQNQAQDINQVLRAGQVSLDPQTGESNMAAEADAKALSAELQSSFGRSAPVQVTQMVDGTLKADLPDDFREVMVFKINPDGTQSIDCVTGSAAAQALLESDGSNVTSTPQLEEQ